MKILVVCNAGMSSSILVQKVRNYGKTIGEEVHIKSESSSFLSSEVGKWDVCLVGPQLMFAVEQVKSILKIPTEVVDMRIYAVADGKGAFEQAKKLYEMNI